MMFYLQKKKENRQNKNKEKDVRERIMVFCADELKDGIMSKVKKETVEGGTL